MERGITPSIPPGKIHLTYVDYCELPDNGKQYEILEGELWMGPAPTPKHQSISANMFRILDQYLKTHPQGRLYYAPLDVILADDTIVQPDLVFVSFANLPRITTRGVEGAPDLVVEILSTSTARKDRVSKSQIYARFGIPNYWLIDPESLTFEAYGLAGSAYRIAGKAGVGETFQPSLFPDLTITLAEIFAET